MVPTQHRHVAPTHPGKAAVSSEVTLRVTEEALEASRDVGFHASPGVDSELQFGVCRDLGREDRLRRHIQSWRTLQSCSGGPDAACASGFSLAQRAKDAWRRRCATCWVETFGLSSERLTLSFGCGVSPFVAAARRVPLATVTITIGCRRCPLATTEGSGRTTGSLVPTGVECAHFCSGPRRPHAQSTGLTTHCASAGWLNKERPPGVASTAQDFKVSEPFGRKGKKRATCAHPLPRSQRQTLDS